MKKILVIENCANTRYLFVSNLKAAGFYAIGAENGQIGINLAQQLLPDLILCDIVIPELDGYGVLTMLRQNPLSANIPFIFVTAKAMRDDLRKGMELGADDYITKPCTIDELLKAITVRLAKQATLSKQNPTEFQRSLTLPPADTARPLGPLEKVFQFIEANYHRPISLSDVAQAVGYSPGYLTELIRRKTGQTVQRWIIEYRMAAARSLLLQSDQSVEQIAPAVGYQNVVHFFRQFRQFYETTPQTWRTLQRTQSVNKVKVEKC